ncbi:MAG: FecR domain-containing protein [Candidatus Omnitrophica bacterium]|nr:FecR domain-containing protein [Candidatus Omnitrophota bacterium]
MRTILKLSLLPLVTLLSAYPLPASAGNPDTGSSGKIIITHAQGRPVIVRGGQTIPAAPGAACQKDDVLKTMTPECVLDVSLNDKAGVRLLPSSECALASADPKAMRIELKNGNAVMNLQTLLQDSTFQVETPTAVASVRGTQFWGRVNPSAGQQAVTTFAVREGFIEILAKASAAKFILEEGEALDIPMDAAPPAVRAALDEEMKAMEQASSIQTTS